MRLLAVSLCLFWISWVQAEVAQKTTAYEELSLQEVQLLLVSKEITITALANYYLKRIDALDDKGIKLNAMGYLLPDVMAQAKKLDEKRLEGRPLGPLYGAVVVIKDNIHVANHPTTAGSYLLRQHVTQDDAFLIERLRQADALILGKANLSEWANFRSEMSSSGWSSQFGQTRNPYDPTRSPCGSSSGSGVAVAADMTLMAVGTETDGSVTCPAAVNGIVGIKPTLGLISRSGIVPLSHSQDTAGPMARTVADAVHLLAAMMGKDDSDPASLAPVNVTDALKSNDLKGMRIGVVRNLMGYHKEVDAIFDQQLETLEAAGATIIDKTNIPTQGKWGNDEYTVLLAEFKSGINQYFADYNAPLKSLSDAIAHNRQFADNVMPVFGQEIFIKAQAQPALSSDVYQQARQNSLTMAGKQGIDAAMSAANLDVLIAPSNGPAWKIDHVNGDHYLGSASSAAAVSGYPHVTVPMGYVRGLPVGMSFIGGHLQDATVIRAAYVFEQRTQARRMPALPVVNTSQ